MSRQAVLGWLLLAVGTAEAIIASTVGNGRAWSWAVSDTGTAVATWLSDIFSAAAIAIALRVFIVENRRFRDEQRAASRRQEKRARRFIDGVVDLVQRAREEIAESLPPLQELAEHPGAQGVTSGELSTLALHIRATVDSLWVFRLKAPEDPGIFMSLARLQWAGEQLRELLKNVGSIAPGEIAGKLIELSDTLGAELIELGKERPEP